MRLFPIPFCKASAKEPGLSRRARCQKDVNKEIKSLTYKPLGIKQSWFIALYAFYLFFVSFIIVILNINYENADLVSLILSDFILVLVFSMVLYMLIKTIFPLNKILIEYNDYNLKIKTIRKVKEIKFEEIENIEIKTHGKLNSGKIIIFTN